MSEPTSPASAPLRVGETVPDFVVRTYDPVAHDFGQVRLEDLRKQGLWTVLFFYPADFTFV